MAITVFPGNYAELWLGVKRGAAIRTSYVSFGMSSPTGYGATTQTLWNGFFTSIATALAPALSNGSTMQNSFFRFNPSASPSFTLGTAQVTAPAVPGTRIAGTMSAPNVAILVTKQVGFVGRSGRLFWPSVGEGDVDEFGNVLAGSVTTLQTAFNAAFAAIDGFDGGASINALRSAPGGVVQAARPVLAFAVQSLAATQRRRMR